MSRIEDDSRFENNNVFLLAASSRRPFCHLKSYVLILQSYWDWVSTRNTFRCDLLYRRLFIELQVTRKMNGRFQWFEIIQAEQVEAEKPISWQMSADGELILFNDILPIMCEVAWTNLT
jgi:hypothetical protein